MIHFLLRFILLNFKAYLLYNFKANPKYGTWEYHCKKNSRETKKIKYELDFTKNQ